MSDWRWVTQVMTRGLATSGQRDLLGQWINLDWFKTIRPLDKPYYSGATTILVDREGGQMMVVEKIDPTMSGEQQPTERTTQC